MPLGVTTEYKPDDKERDHRAKESQNGSQNVDGECRGRLGEDARDGETKPMQGEEDSDEPSPALTQLRSQAQGEAYSKTAQQQANDDAADIHQPSIGTNAQLADRLVNRRVAWTQETGQREDRYKKRRSHDSGQR
jgi:hypothetical protein